jgi:RNA polymerase sigma-70 factor, ECF subfamily
MFCRMNTSRPGPTTPAGDDDSRLVALMCQGDRVAFDRMVLKYQNPILTLCRRLLDDSAEAQDAAQDVFVQVYRKIGAFKGESLFSTWLYRIAVNMCRNRTGSWWNRLRRGAVRLDYPLRPDEDEGESRQIGDTKQMPDKELESARIGARVNAALQSLPHRHKEVVVLRDVKELSYEEIAGITGLSMGTIKSRLARARGALQQMLKGVIDEPQR